MRLITSLAITSLSYGIFYFNLVDMGNLYEIPDVFIFDFSQSKVKL